MPSLHKILEGNIALAVMLEDLQIKATNSCQARTESLFFECLLVAVSEAGPNGGHCLVVAVSSMRKEIVPYGDRLLQSSILLR